MLAEGREQGKRLGRLVADLADERFAVRERAGEELGRDGGPAAEALLRRLLVGRRADADVRKRAEQALAALAGKPMPATHLRQVRALAALERAGTPDAWRAIEELSELEEGAWLRDAARAALQRKAARQPLP